jgi:diguanylate cyclase (GGDEF)-like protein
MPPCRRIPDGDRDLDAARQRTRALEEQVTLLRAALHLLRRSRAETNRRAHFDELTGLPNRFLLLDRFRQAVAHARRTHTKLALLSLDLDGFKAINDTLGHATGDALLKGVSGGLLASIRASDTVCRCGGDEFVVLLAEVADDSGAVRAMQKIRLRLAAPFAIGMTSQFMVLPFVEEKAGEIASPVARSDLRLLPALRQGAMQSQREA